MPKAKKEDLEAQVTHSEETVQEEAVMEQMPQEVEEEVQETELTENGGEENEKDSLADEQEETKVNDEYVDYCLPFLPGVDVGESQTVTLNGKNYQVQYGVPTKVPVGVKEILEDMVKQTRLIKDKIDRLSKEEKCIAKFD